MAVTLLVVITEPLLFFHKKSAIIFDLIFFKALLILVICLLNIAMILSELLKLIGMKFASLKNPWLLY